MKGYCFLIGAGILCAHNSVTAGSEPAAAKGLAQSGIATVNIVTDESVAQAAEPLMPVSSWIDPLDYPEIKVGRDRKLKFLLLDMTIGPNGRMVNCRIENSTGSDDLDVFTCNLLASHAKFSPALDRQGMPTTDHFHFGMDWAAAIAADATSAPQSD